MRVHHEERFLNVAGLTHKSVLIAWGSFSFESEKAMGSFILLMTKTCSRRAAGEQARSVLRLCRTETLSSKCSITVGE